MNPFDMLRMSNGFIYVVDAHFIDKIEKNLKKIMDPSACDTTGSSRLDPGFYGVRVVHICVFFSSCVALPIVCPSMISCFRCSGPFFGE